MIINTSDVNNKTELKSIDESENSRKTSFALVYMDDPLNKLIVGVDLTGHVYLWDLTTYTYKKTLTIGKFILLFITSKKIIITYLVI